MRNKSFWTLVLLSTLVVFTIVVSGWVRSPLYAQPGRTGNPGTQLEIPMLGPPPKWLVNFSTREDLGVQTITIVDPESKTVGVYRVRLDNCEIQMKSIRNISADLKLNVYNGVDPLPQHIEQDIRRESSAY